MKVNFGTSSWSEKSWIGPFYPHGIAPAEMLTYYSTQFKTVEADVTYYRIPSEKMVENWYHRTPEHFVLSAKFPRSIVHAGEGRLPDSRKLLNIDEIGDERDKFLHVMSNLNEKCGPLVLQFPYFNKKVFTSPDHFYEKLDNFLSDLPESFKYGVEVRNARWIRKELVEILKKYGVTLVWTDIPYMPYPDTISQTVDPVTTDFLYVRLIGDRKAVEAKTKSFDRVVVDKSAGLKRWADIINGYGSDVEEIFLYANNHYAGHGPATVRQAVEMLQDL